MSATESKRRWDAVTSAATLGTNRGTLDLSSLVPAPDLSAPSGTPELALLRVAAMSHLWQLAGSRLAPSEAAIAAIPDVAPDSDERFVSEPAVWRLGRMLNGDHRNLVPEWFALAARAGAVLPPQWLPTVLERLQPPERDAARPVFGSRMAWLAARHPAWTFAKVATPSSEEEWQFRPLEERTRELRELHVIDSERARQWLANTWSSELPDARAAFVVVVAGSFALSSADEPFLEAALDDKRKEVRRAAAAGLRRLAGSAHAARNLARLDALVALPESSGLLAKLRKRRLELQLPESLSRADLRDGIDQTPPAVREIGERAYWLMQMISAAPPSHWTTRFACDIETFLDAAESTDYTLDLLLAFAAAAANHADVAWIHAVFRRLVSRDWPDSNHVWIRINEASNAMMLATPPAQRRELLEAIANAAPDDQFGIVTLAHEAAGMAWTAVTTRRAFKMLEREIATAPPSLGGLLASWGRAADIGVGLAAATGLLDRLPADTSARRPLEGLRDILQFRADMQQELT